MGENFQQSPFIAWIFLTGGKGFIYVIYVYIKEQFSRQTEKVS